MGCPYYATHVAQTAYGTFLLCHRCVNHNHMTPQTVRREPLIAAYTRCHCEHIDHKEFDRYMQDPSFVDDPRR